MWLSKEIGLTYHIRKMLWNQLMGLEEGILRKFLGKILITYGRLYLSFKLQ